MSASKKTLLPSSISTVIEIRDKKIDLLSLSFHKHQLQGPIDRNEKETVKGKTSLCFPLKTNSESFLCLQLGAEALGVKGVEKCPHSLLTAVEPELMGVRTLRSAVMVQSLICSRGEVLWGCNHWCYVRADSGLLDCSSRKKPSATTLAGHVAKRCSLMGCCQPAHQVKGNTFLPGMKAEIRSTESLRDKKGSHHPKMASLMPRKQIICFRACMGRGKCEVRKSDLWAKWKKYYKYFF